MNVSKRDAPSVEAALEWFKIGDLGRRYQTSTRNIARMADSGRMPAGTKFGHLRRWSRREIEAWEAGGCLPIRVAKGATR